MILAANDMPHYALQVILAANDMPSINDITYEELVQVISKVFFSL